MHKLSRTVALMGLLAPMGVSALGIGDIRLHSALDQSLVAEIPLVLSGNDTLDDVKVSLAPPEAFAKAGLERQYFLTKLQFTPVQTANGNYIIKVTSRDAITEPFMDFMVEVNWPQGRLLREFTVLLDPPSSMAEQTTAEIAPPELRYPTARTYERVAEIQRSGEAPPRPRRSSATPAPRPVAAPPPPPPSADQLTGEAYGPVRRDETLWNIAKTLNQEPGVTQDQMVIALFRANPQAFSGNRMNGLKAGAVLRVPNRDYIAQLAPNRARSEFARQQGAVSDRGGEPTYEPAVPQAQLKLLAPTEARAKNQAAAPGGDGNAAGRAKGELALEVAETVKQETEYLRSQISQLKQQLGDIQRLLTVKDEQIASLQTQQRNAAQPAKPVAETPVAIQPPPAPKEEPAAPEKQPSVPVTLPPAATSTETATPTPPPASVQPPKPVAPPVTAKPQVPAKPVTPPPAKVPEAEFDYTPYMYAGGAIGIIGLGALLIIRRRNAMIAATESILLAAERESQQRIPLGNAKYMDETPEPVVTTKSSFLSEFTPSDFDALGTENDEVDPVSEADVYLAYGRYKQAEELIRHAIQQHPDRDECKLKLLEIYYATENRAAFESYARELKTHDMDQREGFWEKVEEMGRELLVDSNLFHKAAPPAAAVPTPAPARPTGGSPAAASTLDTAFASSTGSLGSLDLSDDLIDDLKRFEIEFMDNAPGAQSEEDDDLGFISLDTDTEETRPEPKAEAARKEEKSLLDSLEFDLDFLKAAETPSKHIEEPEFPETGELENLIPFDLDMEMEAAPEEASGSNQPDKTIDDILRELTGQMGQEPETSTAQEIAPAAEHPTLGTFDFDFDLLESEATSAEPEPGKSPAFTLDALDTLVLEETQDEPEGQDNLFADLTDMDQFETKLDLAKAYADMEDEESAREILLEVATHGNDRQKAEATALLGKMEGGASGLSLAGQQSER